ncbi:MAG TPA: hypothetical protein VE172_08345 [Stackebrandtia sp.]|jgi:pimeloyl-ACP methyl ester carboxylesterase|uniref:hypothetical protein n=1 Tax=Stackebrandtia sp. TaxID=2023065 RepID=UPI002D56615B|nr:hypothetical protein [Stackebrandtia sp.]HZE38809.1 hypothetical protein [Stackebrandtia sp.]
MDTVVFVHGLGSRSRARQARRDGLGDRFDTVAPELPAFARARRTIAASRP